MMNIKLKPLYRGTMEADEAGRKSVHSIFLTTAPLKQDVYHHGERSSGSACAFNKFSTYSNYLEEQQAKPKSI